MRKTVFMLFGLLLLPLSAHADQAANFQGELLSPIWGIPFAGIILSIALFPLFAPKIWDENFGKITLAWTLSFFLPLIYQYGFNTGMSIFVDALFSEFIPFILLLLVLFAASGGINISGNLVASPKFNVGILALGTVLASVMGTTGAAM